MAFCQTCHSNYIHGSSAHVCGGTPTVGRITQLTTKPGDFDEYVPMPPRSKRTVQIIPKGCHPACACREAKVKELVEAAEKYHKDAGHVEGCDVQWRTDNPRGGPCNCSAGELQAAIKGVKNE